MGFGPAREAHRGGALRPRRGKSPQSEFWTKSRSIFFPRGQGEPPRREPAPRREEPAARVGQREARAREPAPRRALPARLLGQPAPRVGQPTARVGQPTARIAQPEGLVEQPAPRPGEPTPLVGQPPSPRGLLAARARHLRACCGVSAPRCGLPRARCSDASRPLLCWRRL